MEFEWDKEKANENFKKHGVSFEEAALAFFDENAVKLLDELNSDAEIRYQIIGISRTRLTFSCIHGEKRKDSDYIGKKGKRKANKVIQ